MLTTNYNLYLCSDMIRIEFTYSEADNAWVSEKITLDGDIVLKVQLTTTLLLEHTLFLFLSLTGTLRLLMSPH